MRNREQGAEMADAGRRAFLPEGQSSRREETRLAQREARRNIGKPSPRTPSRHGRPIGHFFLKNLLA